MNYGADFSALYFLVIMWYNEFIEKNEFARRKDEIHSHIRFAFGKANL